MPTPTPGPLIPSLPAVLDWADFLVFGLIVTLYTMIRHFMSRPRASVEFTSDSDGVIRFVVYSRKVGRIRRNLLGHRDPLTDLRVFFHIASADGRQFSATMGAGRLVDMFDSSVASSNMTVTRSRPAVMVVALPGNGNAQVPQVNSGIADAPPGTYLGSFEVAWSEDTRAVKRQFTVTASGSVHWAADGRLDL